MASDSVLTIVIRGNPGLLGINNAKKAVVIGGHARIVDVGSVRKSKAGAAEAVWASVLAQPDAAEEIARAGQISVEIDSYWPRRRGLPRAENLALGDVDAPLKLTIDALKEASVIDDDARVIELRARKFIDKLNPRIEMRVRPAEPPSGQLAECK
jgi:Holliday junction resolvase RusA-like endonuclease